MRRYALIAAAVLASATHAFGQGSQFALRFHGTGTGQQDRVRIAIDDDAPGPDASAPCDVGQSSFTVEFWARGTLADNSTTNAGGDIQSSDFRWIYGNIIVDRDIYGGSTADWGVSIAGGFIRFGTGGGDATPQDVETTIEGNVNLLDGAWHHVALVRDAATGMLHIYVDGLLDFASAPSVSVNDISYPNDGVPDQVTPWGPYIVLAAEKHDAGPAYPSFNGFLDEVRIWNVARSQGEILATFDRLVAPNAAGLVAYYRFEEGSGTTIGDSSTAGSPNGQLLAGIVGNGEWVSYAADGDNAAPVSSGRLPAGFVRSTVAGDLNEPTVIEFAPDGRLFIGERSGRILIYENGSLVATPLIQIAVNTLNGERGLVGLAVDPSFATNGYLYAYYTTSEPRNRVGRFTVVGNTANPASELLIWQNPDLAAAFHHGGAIAFGADENLYIATGDQFNSGNSQDLSNEHGKLLRVRPDGTIPPDNPFVGMGAARPAIWALGLRNPFRFVFDGPTSTLWIGDVGGNSFDSWEEINRGVAGANYGWPHQEGQVCYTADCSAFTYPVYTYQHNDPNYYSNINQGSISCGPVYRGAAFPAGYQGNLFFGDYANRWIRRLVVDGTGAVLGDPLFESAPDAGTIVDLDVGPDGALYYVTVGVAWSGASDEGAVYRIAYSGSGNQPPIVLVDAQPRSGADPLSVQFSSRGTYDPDGAPEPLSYSWDFGDGGTSSAPNPQYVYTTRGMYTASLEVSDGADTRTSAPLSITVGMPPTALIALPAEGTTYRAGDTISFSGSASDPDDGPLPVSALTWQVVFVHAGHIHPFLGPLNGVNGGSFQIPATGHAPEDTNYEIRLTATDSDGLGHTAARPVLPELSPFVLDSDPSGIPIFLDGEAMATPRMYSSLVGFRHGVEAQSLYVLGGVPYAFQCWSDEGARVHEYVAPKGGGTLTAHYSVPTGGQTITVAVAANNRNADYHPDFGEELGNFYDGFGLCTGQELSGEWQAAMAFGLGIPQGSVILEATLRVTATGDQAGFPTAMVRAYNASSAAPFSSTHTHRLTEHMGVTGTSATWVFPTFVPNQTYDSPDLAALVQPIVNRVDWSPGNYLGLVLDGAGSTDGTWRCMRNLASGQPGELTVTYSFSTTPGDCCDPPCDDGMFCNGVEVCKAGMCVAGTDPCSGRYCDDSTDTCVDCLTAEQCADGVPCTDDACAAGSCASTPNDALCPDDGAFCNGVERCDSVVGCLSTGSPCETGACVEASESCIPALCDPPMAAAEGPRVLAVTPVAGTDPVALRVRGDSDNPSVSCVSLYVQPDGTLGLAPVFRMPAEWGTQQIRSPALIPTATYRVQGDCGTAGNPNLTQPTTVTTWRWGDVNNSGTVDLDDILCELDGFAGVSQCALAALDLLGCTPDGAIDLDDILSVLDAFGNEPYPCAATCP